MFYGSHHEVGTKDLSLVMNFGNLESSPNELSSG